MRIIRYYILNKETYERVCSSNSYKELAEKLATMDNTKFGIAYKWMSI